MNGWIDEITDFQVRPSLWPAPGLPPLLVIANGTDRDERARAMEPIEHPIPLGVRPEPGDRWLDYGCGYGAFSILAAGLGAELVLPVEPDRDVAELVSKSIWLADAEAVLEPAPALSTWELRDVLERYGIDAIRLDERAPWLELAPPIAKIISIVPARRSVVEAERLEKVFRNVVAPREWRAAHELVRLYAWGRR